MKAAETIPHLLHEAPAKVKNMVPTHVWNLAAPYGISPEKGETRKPDQSA